MADGERLVGDPRRLPALAEVGELAGDVDLALGGAEEGVVDPELALEHGSRPGRPVVGEPRREVGAVRRPRRVDRLRRRPVGEVREEARRPSSRRFRARASSSRRRAARAATTAATPPKTPQIAVGWKPRAWNAPGAAMPTRQTTSFPATIAARSVASRRAVQLAGGERRRRDHGARRARPSPSACRRSRGRGRASRWRRRRSRRGAGRRGRSPSPGARRRARSSSRGPRRRSRSRAPARPQPSVSRTWSFACSTTSAGIVVERDRSRECGDRLWLRSSHTVHVVVGTGKRVAAPRARRACRP